MEDEFDFIEESKKRFNKIISLDVSKDDGEAIKLVEKSLKNKEQRRKKRFEDHTEDDARESYLRDEYDKKLNAIKTISNFINANAINDEDREMLHNHLSVLEKNI